MFIPIGLIMHVLGAARDAQMESAMHASAIAHQSEVFRARAGELWHACTGPDACLVVLGHNDWSACTVDGVRVEVPPQPAAPPQASGGGYRDRPNHLGPGPHGLLGVCPGRHLVETRVDDAVVTLSFTTYPREALFFRLDAGARAWTPYEKQQGESILAELGQGLLGLVNYNEQVAMPQIRSMRNKTRDEAMKLALRHTAEALTHVLDGQDARAVEQARLAATALVGAPVSSFEPLTTLVGFHAYEALGKGLAREAWMFLQAGLAILPDDPTLLASLGELQLNAGALDQGAENLERALAREVGLDARLVTRCRELLAARRA